MYIVPIFLTVTVTVTVTVLFTHFPLPGHQVPREVRCSGHSVVHHVEALSFLYRLEVRANSRATH